MGDFLVDVVLFEFALEIIFFRWVFDHVSNRRFIESLIAQGLFDLLAALFGQSLVERFGILEIVTEPAQVLGDHLPLLVAHLAGLILHLIQQVRGPVKITPF